MKEIRVEVDVGDLLRDREFTPSNWEMAILSKLKSAGIPVKGTIKFRGLKSGSLFRLDDPRRYDKCVYVWKDDEVDGQP